MAPRFTIEERDRIRDRVLAMARADARIVGGAVVGSMSIGPGDEWSDLDLTFGLAPGVAPRQILDGWTPVLAAELGAVHLVDVPFRTSLYRVFLMPGRLQVDLSFTPGEDFGATSPRFRLLFGRAIEKPHVAPPAPRDLFGLGVLYALHARTCLARGRLWQAEYMVRTVRDHALELACVARGLPAREGRGLDDLPPEVAAAYADCLVLAIDAQERDRALGRSIAALLREGGAAGDLPAATESALRELASG